MTRATLACLLIAAIPTRESVPHDSRLGIIYGYLADRHCPARLYTDVFVAESDAHQLDWRLLPAIAFVESSGGKYMLRPHNMFGWAQGRRAFPSGADAIHTVAQALAESPLYHGKCLAGKLATYNPHAGYAAKVLGVMRDLSRP